MAQFTGKYLKVWKTEDKGKYVKINLGDSIKKKDGTYQNWTWFNVAFVGKCVDLAKTLNEKDTIEVTSGTISQAPSNEDGKYYTNIAVYDFEVTKRANGGGNDSFSDYESIDDDDDLPF